MSLVFGLVRSELMQGETVAETESLRQYLAEAERFLRSHGWCGEIVERYFGYGVPDVLAIFLIRIRPLQPHVDEDLWVIVGDVPPAYIVTEGNDTPRDALAGYVEEMNRWVEAVERLESVKDLIPVNVEPTRENAAALRRRLNLIQREILPTMETGAQ